MIVHACISQGYHCVKDSLAMTHYSTAALHPILISHTIVEIANGIFWKGSNQPPSGVVAMPPPLLQHFPIVIIVMSYVVQQTQVVLIMYCIGS